jgi:hypothetical protein
LDAGEKRDLAAQEPQRLTALKSALAEWRTANDVQYNSPNPDCDEEEFRKLYVAIDSSKFDPAAANDAEWARMQDWRQQMNRLAPWQPERTSTHET